MENVNLKVGLNASVETWFPRKVRRKNTEAEIWMFMLPRNDRLDERAALSAVALHLPKGIPPSVLR